MASALHASCRSAPRPGAALPRQPRQGTKRHAVLALLRQPDGATVAQIAEATGWGNQTTLGFFVGLKKRGIEVSVLERVRHVGPGKQGAKGSYRVYRIAEAGWCSCARQLATLSGGPKRVV